MSHSHSPRHAHSKLYLIKGSKKYVFSIKFTVIFFLFVAIFNRNIKLENNQQFSLTNIIFSVLSSIIIFQPPLPCSELITRHISAARPAREQPSLRHKHTLTHTYADQKWGRGQACWSHFAIARSLPGRGTAEMVLCNSQLHKSYHHS